MKRKEQNTHFVRVNAGHVFTKESQQQFNVIGVQNLIQRDQQNLKNPNLADISVVEAVLHLSTTHKSVKVKGLNVKNYYYRFYKTIFHICDLYQMTKPF